MLTETVYFEMGFKSYLSKKEREDNFGEKKMSQNGIVLVVECINNQRHEHLDIQLVSGIFYLAVDFQYLAVIKCLCYYYNKIRTVRETVLSTTLGWETSKNS